MIFYEGVPLESEGITLIFYEGVPLESEGVPLESEGITLIFYEGVPLIFYEGVHRSSTDCGGGPLGASRRAGASMKRRPLTVATQSDELCIRRCCVDFTQGATEEA